MNLLLLLLFSCFLCELNAQIEFYECPKKAKYEYVSNAKLVPTYFQGQDSTLFNYQIDTGKSVVLRYEHYYDCSETGHLGVYATFIWSIPFASTSFEIQLDKIDSLQTPLNYLTGCGPPCKQYNYKMIQATGSLRGELIKKVWYITGKLNMVLYNNYLNTSISKDLIIDGTYVLWKQKRQYKKGHKFHGF
jgi:hypothetical protein